MTLRNLTVALIFFGGFSSILCNLDGPLDLTWSFENDTIYWGNIQPFKFTKKVATTLPSGTFYAMNEFCAGEHGGTHLDAPYHFSEKGATVGQIPLHSLIVHGNNFIH